jgi:hypothetical protein
MLVTAAYFLGLTKSIFGVLFVGSTKLHLNSSDFGWIRSSAYVRIVVVVLLQIILPFLKNCVFLTQWTLITEAKSCWDSSSCAKSMPTRTVAGTPRRTGTGS